MTISAPTAPPSDAVLDPTRLLGLLDRVPSVVLLLDTHLRCRVANAAAARWAGLARADELIGQALSELVPPVTWAALRPHAQVALAGGTTAFTLPLAGRDGRSRHVQVTLAPELGSGRVTGVVLHAGDVTERRSSADRTRRQDLQLVELRERERIVLRLSELVTRRLFAVSMLLVPAAQDDTRQDARDTAGRVRAAIDEIDDVIVAVRSALFGVDAAAPA